MILGIGTDIVQIARMQKLYARFGLRLLERLLHPEEVALAHRCSDIPRFLSKRFAAKEAISKAFKTGISNGVLFKEIQIYNNENGAPEVRLHHAAQQQWLSTDNLNIHVSLTDEKDVAMAFVIVEKH